MVFVHSAASVTLAVAFFVHGVVIVAAEVIKVVGLEEQEVTRVVPQESVGTGVAHSFLQDGPAVMLRAQPEQLM